MAKTSKININKSLEESIEETQSAKTAKKQKGNKKPDTPKVSRCNVKVWYGDVNSETPYEVCRSDMPEYKAGYSCGADVIATSVEYDELHDAYVYHTGLVVESDSPETALLLLPRSSNMKTEYYMPHSMGLVEPYTYRGEIKFIYKNRTSLATAVYQRALNIWMQLSPYKRMFKSWADILEQCKKHELRTRRECADAPYAVGDRIGQMVFLKGVQHAEFKIVKDYKDLRQTERGKGGFGSTGK